MDAVLAGADVKSIRAEHDNKRLALRRIDAQLAGRTFSGRKAIRPSSRCRSTRSTRPTCAPTRTRSAQEQSLLEKARHDLAAAQSTQSQARAGPAALHRAGAGVREADERRLRRPHHVHRQAARAHREGAGPAHAGIHHSQQPGADRAVGKEDRADHRRLPPAAADRARRSWPLSCEKLTQELAKISHRHELLELRAPRPASSRTSPPTPRAPWPRRGRS